MAKKLTATLLSLALAGTMIPANVMAEEEALTLKGFNATKSVITLDFNNVTSALDAESLDGRINIQKRDANGEISEITDYTVDVTETMSGTDADGAEVTTAEGNTVVITPAEGLETGALYYVTVYGGVVDSDETYLEDDAKTGWFEVKELYADDFNVKYEADGVTPIEPYYLHTNGKTMQHRFWNGASLIKNTAGTDVNDMVINMANNNRVAALLKDGVAEITNDYTIEFTQYKYQKNYTNIDTSALITSIRNPELLTRNDSYNYIDGGYSFAITDTTWQNATHMGPVEFKINKTSTLKVPSYDFGSTCFNVRISAIDNNIQMFVGSDKLIDYTDTNNKYAAGSTTGFKQSGSHSGASQGVDNVSITTVVNHGEIDFSGIAYKGFNATKSAIILDFTGVNNTIDTASVADRLEIIKKTSDGEEYVTDYTLESKESLTGNGGTVVIEPTEGIDTSAKYKVNVYGGIMDAAGVIMEDDVTIDWFMVEELFADDFNADGHFNVDEHTAEYPYYWDDTNTYILSKNWDFSDKAAKLHIGNTTKNHNYVNHNVLRWTNSAGATISQEAYPSSEWVTDYTVEYTYQYPGYANNGSHTVAMGSGKGNAGYKLQLRNGTATSSSLAADAKLYVGGKVVETVPNFAPEAAKVEIRMSAIGDNIQCYVDNAKLFDINDTAHRSAGTVVLGDNCSAANWNPSYVDDISVTRVVDLDMFAESTEVLSYNADTDTVYLELDKTALAGNSITETALGGVKLYDKDGTEMSASVSMQGNWILVKPESKLDIKKKYTVEVKGLTTKFGTIINDYSKDFQLVKAYGETFDTEESVTEGWNTRKIGSWDSVNGRMNLKTTGLQDYIYSNEFKNVEEAEYVTEFDLYIYDNDDDPNNALVFNNFLFYSNYVHNSAYNTNTNTNGLMYSFGLSRKFGVSANKGSVSLYSADKSSNLAVTAGNKLNIKMVNKNGTGFVYINDVLEASYDYSAYAPLYKGCLGFYVYNVNAGIDNILCTYAIDYVDDGGEGATPSIEITKAEISQPVEGKVTTDITVQNNTYNGEKYAVAVALYDANHKLVGIATAKETAVTVGTAKDYAPEITGVTSYSYAKVFLWDGIETMNPIGTMRTISGTTEIAYFVNPSADLMSADGSPENPYPTIDLAMDRIESEVDSGAFNVNFTINVAEGDIFLDDTLKINDYKGTLASAGATVTVNGQGADKTFIKSGKVINNGDFYKVTDESILERVPGGAKNYIYAVDLVEKGYVNNGESLEISKSGKIQTVAKYPNSGYLKTGDVTEDALSFECSDKRVSAWESADDMYVYYMPNYFSYAYKVMAEDGLITTANNAGFAKGKKYYVYNLIEELDCENEYYYDKVNGVLYIYSTATPTEKFEVFNMEKKSYFIRVLRQC